MFIILQHHFIGVNSFLNPDGDLLMKVFLPCLFVIQEAWDQEQWVHSVTALCARDKSHWQSSSKKEELFAGPGAVPFGLYSLRGTCTQSILSLLFCCLLSPSLKACVFCLFYPDTLLISGRSLPYKVQICLKMFMVINFFFVTQQYPGPNDSLSSEYKHQFTELNFEIQQSVD